MTYRICTFGCQMNKHDSERVAGLLEESGLCALADDAHDADADVVVYLTCCVREAADKRLFGQVASLKSLPDSAGAPKRRLVAVGGCIGQRDGAALVESFPHIDVVFGTHNIARLPELLAGAHSLSTPQVEVLDGQGTCATDLPSRREHRWHAWVPIMTGCDNFCSYCVVPYVRGRERSRTPDDVLREVTALLGDGVREVTLLGQNVNSYGRDLFGEPRFATLLRQVAGCGVERIRFATSHPKDISDETIAAFAELPAVMPALHLPVQSGSDAVLRAMRRNYTAEHYLGLVRKVREAAARAGKGEVALSTDVIVGFPGESDADFEATMDLMRAVGYAQAFTFIYSRREQTPAARLHDDTPRAVVQERFDRLVALVQQSAWGCNQLECGRVVEVLFEGASKRDARVLAGKSPKNQTVHAPLPPGAAVADFTGEVLPVRIDTARTWYLSGALLNEALADVSADGNADGSA